MKLSFIPTAMTLTLSLGITWLNASFSNTAYAVDDGKTGVCEIPTVRPSGGNTLQRMLAMQLCEQAQLNQQQKLTVTPIKQSNPASSIALPTQSNQAPTSGVNDSNTSQPTPPPEPIGK
ncbi:MAG: hypothetical protein RMX68_014545 [Aulosira sp. ZfuVER01]|nr:hypothetical protein [Aulosira sp. ZfuVER01]MDZ7996641.1 hypothetical protein [Aulosira sp. DedVER01a]MDZ8053856.1 hypothetical protein [Aulosira sp. ZfuCHP01]